MNPTPEPPPMRQRYLRLTLINILSNVTVPLAGLVDTAMLGHLADYRFLAGVGLASILFDYFYWTLGFLRMGTTGTTAQSWGRGDHHEVFVVLYRATMLAVVLGTLVVLLQYPMREAGFALLSGTPGVEQAGRDYFNARIWGGPATLCNFAIVGWLLGREQSRHVLWMTIVANLANIFFNYLFIIRMGLAATGAGLATMISQYMMLAVGVTIVLAQPGRPAWLRAEVADRAKLGALLRLNRDILVRTLCLATTFAVFTNLGSILGTRILAANILLGRLLTLGSYSIDGAAFASESLGGIFRGKRDAPSLSRLNRLSLLTGFLFAALGLAIFFAAPRTLLSLLTSHTELIDLALTYAPWLIPTLLLGSLAYMYDGLFLGLTEGRRLRNSMLFSTAVIFTPLALLALHLENNHLLWAALAIFMAARTITLWAYMRGLTKRFSSGSF